MGTTMTEAAMPPGSELPDADIMQIMRLIPHRYPFLLVDRVVQMRAFVSAVGVKNVTMNEWFFQGHFPDEAIMPGVLLIEAMAQTAAVLIVSGLGPTQQRLPVYFMSIHEARFRRPVRPGDQVRIEITAQRHRLGVSKFGGLALIEGKTVAEAEFTAKISQR
jgi:3-hydroxyacyl-[acyl-carrier-protein] dehydratase